MNNSGSSGVGKPNDPAPCELFPQCPVCDGTMESVYERPHQKVCQCLDCACTLTVPVAAWEIAAAKRRTPPAP